MSVVTTPAPTADSTFRNGVQAVGRRIAMTFQKAPLTGAVSGVNAQMEWNYDFTPQNVLKLTSLSVTKTRDGILKGATYGGLLTVGVYRTFADPVTNVLMEEDTAVAQVAFHALNADVVLGESHFAGVLDEQSYLQGVHLITGCLKGNAETGSSSNQDADFWPSLNGALLSLPNSVGIRIKIFAERAEEAQSLDPSVMIEAEFFECHGVDGLNTDSAEMITITDASN